jgi:regulator of replication initiation timing
MSEQFEKPPVWWKDVLHTAWRELARANKGNRRLARKVKALERQLGEVVAERDAADDLLQSMELSYSALREECTTLRQSLQRAEARRKAEVTANMVGGIQVEDGNKYAGADNLAIVLASYFERHMDRPEPDPEGENGWGEWAEAKARKAMQIIADEINKAREPLTASDGGES